MDFKCGLRRACVRLFVATAHINAIVRTTFERAREKPALDYGILADQTGEQKCSADFPRLSESENASCRRPAGPSARAFGAQWNQVGRKASGIRHRSRCAVSWSRRSEVWFDQELSFCEAQARLIADVYLPSVCADLASACCWIAVDCSKCRHRYADVRKIRRLVTRKEVVQLRPSTKV